jgi:PEP-CTERM motif
VFIRPVLIGLVLAAPWLAQAAHTVTDSTLLCSDALTFSDTSSLVARCTGDLSITGGSWNSDVLIDISADGKLALNGVSFNAPVIQLKSSTEITTSDNVTLTASDKLIIQGDLRAPSMPPLQGGDVVLSAPPRVLHTSTIPEPTSAALSLLGLGLCAFRLRRRTV